MKNVSDLRTLASAAVAAADTAAEALKRAERNKAPATEIARLDDDLGDAIRVAEGRMREVERAEAGQRARTQHVPASGGGFRVVNEPDMYEREGRNFLLDLYNAQVKNDVTARDRIEAARVGDLDEERGAWLVRASVSKTRRARWVDLPADLLAVLLDRLPAREDRDPAAALFGDEVTADRLRTAIGRACRDSGVPTFSPHALRHRRISLLHRQGESWAAIGERMGQRSKLVTADTYTHALIDSREIDRAKLLVRLSVGYERMSA